MLNDAERRAIAARLMAEGFLDLPYRHQGGSNPLRSERGRIPPERLVEIVQGAEPTDEELKSLRGTAFFEPFPDDSEVLPGLDPEERKSFVLDPVQLPTSSDEIDTRVAAATGGFSEIVRVGDLDLVVSVGASRPEILLKLVSTEEHANPYDGRAYFLALDSSGAEVAVFCDESAVYTDVLDYQVLGVPTTISARYVYPWSATEEELAIVKMSRAEAIDPDSHPVYDDFLEESGLDVDTRAD